MTLKTTFLTLESVENGKNLDENLSLLRAANLLFAEVFEEWDTYQATPPSDDYLKKLLQKPNFLTVVGIQGGEVVGALTAYILEKFEQERREMYIYDLAVHADHRRQKIATNMIKHLHAEAQKRRVYITFVQADDGDTPAIKLYESLGTKEKVLHFDLDKVDPPN